MFPVTIASVASGLIVWWFFSSLIVANPTLESLFTSIFQLALGLIIGVISYKLKPLNAYITVPITILILMAVTRLVSGYSTTFSLDPINFLINFLLYLPVASIAFFATWTFIQIARVRYA